METTVKQRLKEYINHKGISVRLFESTCGLSYGYVSNMRVSIQPDKVMSIAKHYPDLNAGWLLTGEGEMLKNGEKSLVTIVPKKSIDKLQDRVPIYNVEARMGLISLYDTGKVETIGEIYFPNMPRSDAAIIARGDSMYPLIKSGAIVAFRKLNSFDFFIPGEIYVVNFVVDGDNYNVFKYVQSVDGNNEQLKLVSYNSNHSELTIMKKDVIFMGLVTFWVNISAS